MRKSYFTMVNTLTYEVNEEFMNNANSFKEAFENGDIKVVAHNVTLVNQDGSVHTNATDIDIIKNAILYGLVEKG